MALSAIWKKSDADSKKDVPIHVGDTVRVHYKLIEKEKVAGKTKREVHEETRTRIQPFEGIVIAIKGLGTKLMFTVRKIGVSAIGIERIFPLVSPWISKIDVVKHGKVRRAKLYFIRQRTGKLADRLHEQEFTPKPATG